MIENKDYQLTISDQDDHWNIRILNGDYVETVFKFGSIAVNEDNESMTFNLDIVSSPDADLTVDDIDFQKYCGNILQSIIINALERAEDYEFQSEEDVIDESQY